MYLGVDPGKSGAMALVDTAGFTHDWIGFHETPHDVAKWLKLFAPAIDFAVIEKVGARPGQGTASMFKFGEKYGFAIGLLVAINIKHEFHLPSRWQKKLGLIRPKMSNAEKKKVNKAAAQALFRDSPKIIHRNADAFLIAEYARRISLGVL
tara:strand:+ start:57 stop:509 length:453 start_codon:yes stop_codon:yes gene_type:complete